MADDGYFLFFVFLDNKTINAIARRDWYVDGTRSRYGIFFRFLLRLIWSYDDRNSARSEQSRDYIWILKYCWDDLFTTTGKRHACIVISPLKRGFWMKMMTLHYHKRAPPMLWMIITVKPTLLAFNVINFCLINEYNEVRQASLGAVYHLLAIRWYWILALRFFIYGTI